LKQEARAGEQVNKCASVSGRSCSLLICRAKVAQLEPPLPQTAPGSLGRAVEDL